MQRGRDQDSSPQQNRLPAPSSSSSPTNECPVFANLSPLKPEKAKPYRFTGTNYPSPRQLFTLPHLEQQQESVFRDANSNVGDNVVQIPRPGKEIKSCSQECLANPVELDSIRSTKIQFQSIKDTSCSLSAIADDGDAGTRALVCLRSPEQVKEVDETTGDQRINERADEFSDFASKDLSNIESTTCPRPVSGEQPVPEGNRASSSIILDGIEYHVGNIDRISPSYINCRPLSNISSRSVHVMDTNKNECAIHRRLNFDTCVNPTYNSNQASPKKKRKRATVSESDGCKQCNCKRSKCLKLYCECFASGSYCLDTCACSNCFNKLDYEDTVHDARQQIETRNPHAFAPKVVDHSPRNTTEDTKLSSARHKRECNCKKSKCLKKYCECYQSKVGCSDGCRCDNCQNSFGTKTETEKLNRGQTYTDSIKGMELSSTRQQLDFAPSAPPCSDVAVYSNLWNYAQASQSQFGTRFLPNGSSRWPYPLNICTQQLHTSGVLHDYSQNEDITKDQGGEL